MSELDDLAVSNFRTYLRFKTVQPDPDYSEAVEWLRQQGSAMGLVCKLSEPCPGNPILVMCWEGSRPELPSILLNSHMDVVPVETGWTHDPFAADMDEEGRIYARGAQDMKSVGIQQLEAVRRLKLGGFTPVRTIYLSFVPDEERGGTLGMRPFVEGRVPIHPGARDEIRFADMNVGFCLDEGIPSPTEDYIAFYEERSPWWLRIVCHGTAGHGSIFLEDTAFEKLHFMLTKVLELRTAEKKRLEECFGPTGLGNVITANVTVLRGGVQTNVVPASVYAEVDFRLPPTIDFKEFETRLHAWAAEAGSGVELQFLQQDMGTSGHGGLKAGVDDSNPWWSVLKRVLTTHGAGLKIEIFPGATDARFLRRYHRLAAGVDGDADSPHRTPIQAINFSPMRNTPVLLHSHDEFLSKDEFLRGLALYTDLVRELSSLP
ncbi:hypothetical protein AAHC03_016631 [Spirometra sp. Aus1]|nr:unnamed protein product [Spirometra erinaceieuropaei]